MQLEHWLLNAAAVQQSRVALLAQLRDASERGVKIQPEAEKNLVVRGWLELGAARGGGGAQSDCRDGRPELHGCADHPSHPAVEVVRSELLGEQPQPLAAQAHIALLLPITGCRGSAGGQRA